MDKQHWMTLFKIDNSIIYLLPQPKWLEIIKTSNKIPPSTLPIGEYSRGIIDNWKNGIVLLSRIPGYPKNEVNFTLYTAITKQELISQFNDKAKECLTNSEYDLKEWEDG